MKKIIHITYVIVALVMLIPSCREQDEFYKDYYQIANEYRYPQSMNSFKAESGYYAILVSWAKVADPSVVRAKIFWDNGKDSLVVDMKDPSLVEGDYARLRIDNISEGVQNIVSYTFDSEGNRSLPSETSVTVRGDEYISTLSERTIKSITREGDEVIIAWNTRTRNLSFCEFEYPSTSGTKIIKVDAYDTATVIGDYDFTSEVAFRYRSAYGMEDLIDILYKPWTNGEVVK